MVRYIIIARRRTTEKLCRALGSAESDFMKGWPSYEKQPYEDRYL
jgi:hypothetical protein